MHIFLYSWFYIPHGTSTKNKVLRITVFLKHYLEQHTHSKSNWFGFQTFFTQDEQQIQQMLTWKKVSLLLANKENKSMQDQNSVSLENVFRKALLREAKR